MAVIVAIGALAPGQAEAHGGPLPSGFRDTVAIDDLSQPTAFRIAPDGRIFIAQKNGVIVVFDDFDDPTPQLFADLRKEVYDQNDRGLLGLALDPDFENRPYVYALYTFDHVLGEDDPGEFPHWGQPPLYEGDPCSLPENACPVSGRLVRLTEEDGEAVAEKVLLTDWCQQFSSHSIGSLNFGPEGALYVSGGDGASFTDADYGQFGNPCGDPPGGGDLEPPDAEGGSLRSLDLLTPFDPLEPDDPTGLNGTLIRIDPATGAGWPGNPLASSADANERRIVAFGFRNPFRFTIDPEREQVFVGNVGNGSYDEVDRLPLLPAVPYNSGWPCYEGPGPNPGFEGLELDLCDEVLYPDPAATAEPFFFYRHGTQVTPGDDHCPPGNGSAITGLAVYRGDSFPDEYDGALFFADAVRGCIYVIPAGDDGELDPLAARPFLNEGGTYTGADLQVGPDGHLYYISLYADEALRRISYDPGAPVARLEADKLWDDDLPMTVEFDAGESEDPDDGGELEFEWDLDGNGSYESAGGSTRTRVFNNPVNATVGVRVTDDDGKSGTDRVTVYPGDRPPRIVIEDPLETQTWGIGEEVELYGKAWADAGDGTQLEAKRLYWRSTLAHCPGGPTACHLHPLRMLPGVETGALVAPDHDYPSRIEITLTATDARGLAASKTVTLQPRAVELSVRSEPPGISLTAGPLTRSDSFVLTAIEGANVTLAAPSSAQLGGRSYAFQGWSDGGARVHSLVADAAGTYTAGYTVLPGPPQPPDDGDRGEGEKREEGTAPDERPPVPVGRPTLSVHPAKRSARTVARFAFDGPEPGLSYRCKLDGKPYAACSSPRVYRRLQPGGHVFRVAVEDAGGSIASPPATFRWRVLAAGR